MRPTALAACAALLLAGCGDGGGDRNGRSGGSITIAQARAPDSLDPAAARTAAAREAIAVAYTPPLTYRRTEGRDGTRLVPGLAAALPISSTDGLQYVVTLRPRLRFAPGRPLRARDVAHTLARARALNPDARAALAGVSRVKADDRAHRVTIVLRAPDPSFPHALAATWAGVVPAGTPIADRTRRPPPGIGPYRIARVYPDGGYVLRRRHGFRLPAVPGGNVDRIAVRTVADAGRAARAVIDGRVDHMQARPPAALLPEIRSTYAGRYREVPTLTTLYAFMDSRRPPFRDERVRRAVAFALDMKRLRPLNDGFMRAGCRLLPAVVGGDAEGCPYGDREGDSDLVRARALVERSRDREAGVTVDFPRDPDGRRLARAYVRTLRKIGLRARPARASRGAHTGLTAVTPKLPVPGAYFTVVEDPEASFTVRLRAAELEREARAAPQLFARLDRDVVESAYVAPYGTATAGIFLSERLDSRNCVRYSVVYGTDWSAFCLR